MPRMARSAISIGLLTLVCIVGVFTVVDGKKKDKELETITHKVLEQASSVHSNLLESMPKKLNTSY